MGLPVADALALFHNPGDKEITADQFLDSASAVPLGISRAEMQQLFSKIDTDGVGRIALQALEIGISRANASDCDHVPPWIAAGMQRGLAGRVRDELKRIGGIGGADLARDSDFRRIVMQTEKYLTGDQLNSLLLLLDKSPSGHVDYEEFAQRFSGSSAAVVLRIPGGALPALAGVLPGGELPSEDEFRVVCSRTGAVLDRNGLAPERLSALVALWGHDLQNDQAAAVLASLPLGLSRKEAAAQVRASGSIKQYAQKLAEVRMAGVWQTQCGWAAMSIPGSSLRTSIQRNVIEADSRTLDPNEFMRLLVDAGVAPGNMQPAMWLAEKSGNGDILVSEFLASFGGPPPATAKKKRGMFARIMGR